MLFPALDDPWAQTLIYEGGAIWPSYPEGGLTMVDNTVANGVPVKSLAKSKILWTAVLAVVVYLVTTLTHFSEGDKATLVAAFGILQNVAIGAFRIWANNTVTPEFNK